MDTQYRSDAFAAVHETMASLHEIGAITQVTMRQFDGTCLEPYSDNAEKLPLTSVPRKVGEAGECSAQTIDCLQDSTPG